jgi:tRNA (adenine22-N1)-methyltransferase
MGPWLLQQVSPLLIHKWQQELVKWLRIQDQLKRSDTEEAEAKYHQMTAEIQELEEILLCLQMAKPSSN